MPRRGLGSDVEQHERELKSDRRSIDINTKAMQNALTRGDCGTADRMRKMAVMAIGSGHVHHDASTSMLGQGAFGDFAEVKRFAEADVVFKTKCLMKRAR